MDGVTPVALLVGIILVLSSVGLFFFDRIKPAYARDSDKVYATLILLAGIVTIAGLFTFDLGASFVISVMAGMLGTLYVENIRKREPRVLETGPSRDFRPPAPRYNARPPVQRGYRAEIERDPYRERPPIDFPARRQAQVNAAKEATWNGDYADGRNASRQPYEEYRGPAGRLQPSPADRGSDNRGINRPQDMPPNGRGPMDRPPTGSPPTGSPPTGRPPTGRPPVDRPQNSRPQGDRYVPNGDPNGSSGGGYDAGGDRYGERPPARPPASERPERGTARPAGTERALNVRPYSEAPRQDLPPDDDYRTSDAGRFDDGPLDDA